MKRLFSFILSLLTIYCTSYAVYFEDDVFGYESIGNNECQLTGLNSYLERLSLDYSICLDFNMWGINEIIIPSEITYGDSTYSVAKIKMNALSCTKTRDLPIILNKLVIPSSIREIGYFAFRAAMIDTLVVVRNFPPKATMMSLCQQEKLFDMEHWYKFLIKKIVVPSGSKYRYEHAPGWCWISSYIESDLEYPDTDIENIFEDNNWVATILPREDFNEVELNYCVNDSNRISFPEYLYCNNTEYKVTAIGQEIISHCAFQEELYIPGSVTKLSCGAFFEAKVHEITGMQNVTDISYDTFESTYLKRLKIPLGVTQLPGFSFSSFNKTNIEYLEFHENLIGISYRAFESTYVDTLVCKSTTPPKIENDTFYNELHVGVLYVPEGCVDIYRNTPGWSVFKDIRPIGTSTISEIHFNDIGDNTDDILYYNMQGMPVSSTRKGEIYIVRRGSKSRKVITD